MTTPASSAIIPGWLDYARQANEKLKALNPSEFK